MNTWTNKSCKNIFTTWWSKYITMHSINNKKYSMKIICILNKQFPSSFFNNIILNRIISLFIFNVCLKINCIFLIVSCNISTKSFNNNHGNYTSKKKNNNNRIYYWKPMNLNICHCQICIPTKKKIKNNLFHD